MKRSLLVLTICTLLLIVAACGEDDENEESTSAEPSPTVTEIPSPTEEPKFTPTPEPEPSPTITPTAEISEDDEPNEDSSASDSPLSGNDDAFSMAPEEYFDDFHDQALSDRLLATEHLPAGWDVVMEGSYPKSIDPSQEMDQMMTGLCGNDLLTPRKLGGAVHVGRSFAGTDLGPFFGQDLYKFEDDSGAVGAMEMITSQLDCEEWTSEDPLSGMGIRYTVNELAFPDLGDQMLAASIKVEINTDVQAGIRQIQQPAQADELFGSAMHSMVVIRQGPIIASFTYVDWINYGGFDLEASVSFAMERLLDAQTTED